MWQQLPGLLSFTLQIITSTFLSFKLPFYCKRSSHGHKSFRLTNLKSHFVKLKYFPSAACIHTILCYHILWICNYRLTMARNMDIQLTTDDLTFTRQIRRTLLSLRKAKVMQNAKVMQSVLNLMTQLLIFQRSQFNSCWRQA